jgi:hypothetical protein
LAFNDDTGVMSPGVLCGGGGGGGKGCGGETGEAILEGGVVKSIRGN